MPTTLQHLSESSVAAIVLWSVSRLLYVSLAASVQSDITARNRVQILLSAAACVALLLLAALIVRLVVAPFAHSSDTSESVTTAPTPVSLTYSAGSNYVLDAWRGITKNSYGGPMSAERLAPSFSISSTTTLRPKLGVRSQ